jgi:predicted metallopeptidase
MDIALLVRFLNLRKPFVIRIKSTPPKKYAGLHWSWLRNGKVISHSINVHLWDGRELETLIAHELIHAWQAETGGIRRAHGKKFQRKAAEIEETFGIKEIYLPEYDKD